MRKSFLRIGEVMEHVKDMEQMYMSIAEAAEKWGVTQAR